MGELIVGAYLKLCLGCAGLPWFRHRTEAKAKIEDWRLDYNESRPHQALREQTLVELAVQVRDPYAARRCEFS
jgi:transposase InsO family protein